MTATTNGEACYWGYVGGDTAAMWEVLDNHTRRRWERAANAAIGQSAATLGRELAAAQAARDTTETAPELDEAQSVEGLITELGKRHLQINKLTAERDEARADRDSYAERLRATDKSWTELAGERDALRTLIADMLQSFPDTADEQEWRDRAGALGVTDPDGQPYRAYTGDDL